MQARLNGRSLMANIYLNEDNVDDLGRMVVALLSELWIMRDRMARTEALLAQKGTVTVQEIEGYQPSPAITADIEAVRDRMVASVLGAPIAAHKRSVDDVLARAGLAAPAAHGGPP